MSNWLSNLFTLRRREERVSAEQIEQAVNDALLSDTVFDNTSRKYITEEGALNLSAVWACVRILSETVGTLPVHLYKRTGSGRERASGHPCIHILHTRGGAQVADTP